jgi:hypothetical protein
MDESRCDELFDGQALMRATQFTKFFSPCQDKFSAFFGTIKILSTNAAILPFNENILLFQYITNRRALRSGSSRKTRSFSREHFRRKS